MTKIPHLNSRSARRCALLFLLAAALGAAANPASSGVPAGYNWPVKPFDRAHPVRANFGDPRTTFLGGPTMRTLMTSGGIFQFHFGIDIAVPDGTPVYAVRSGVVSLPDARVVAVDSGNGFATQYWHIVPSVRRGQHVTAEETVLGHVLKGYEHVHFTELDHGVAVNPLEVGHLAPYDDTTKPQVGTISFREPDGESEQLPESVHGPLLMVASAFDMPAMRVPGIWADLPTAPALLTWHIERAKDRRVLVHEQTAFDVRHTLPVLTEFWQRYARGTRQNMSTFNGQRAWREPGVYLYKLTRAPFDTARIANGIYRVVVTAKDIRGNSGSASQTFIVRNPLPA
jgi:Peptidase family M23